MSKYIIHRDSQNRIYLENHPYFITTNTYRRYPYFNEKIFCNLFITCLKICKKLKRFKLYSFVLMPDHAHLLIKPNKKYNISEIMHFLKRHTSRNINIILDYQKSNPLKEGEVGQPRLQMNNLVNKYKKCFSKTHLKYKFPKFKWQQSFYDHIIRNEKDLMRHIKYILINPTKRGVEKNYRDYLYSSINQNHQRFISKI